MSFNFWSSNQPPKCETFNGRLIIGITGNRGSGKNTVAQHLVKKHNFYKKSLTEPLKDACKCLFHFTDEQVIGNSRDIPDENWFGVTPQETMQFVGTDLLRKQMSKLKSEFGEDIFLHNFRNWYEGNNYKLIVVPDVQFQNEVDFIRSQNGVVIKVLYNVTADEVSLLDRIKNFLGLGDKYEQNVEYDLMVNNGCNYPLQDLYGQIDCIVKQVVEQKMKDCKKE